MDQNTDMQVQQRAYKIWENEGRPDGCAERHWQQAQTEMTAQNGQDQMGPAESSEVAQLSAEGTAFQPKMRRQG
jgi:hypothetical protein